MSSKRVLLLLIVMLGLSGCQSKNEDLSGITETEKVSNDVIKDGSQMKPEKEKESTVPDDALLSDSGLPSYSYGGEDAYLKGVCEYFCELSEKDREGKKEYAASEGKGSDVVYIPVPVVMKTETADQKVWLYGTFWDMWYVLEGTNLYCLTGGENTGRLELTELDGAFQVTGFEKVRDGGDYAEDWKRLCGDDQDLYDRLFTEEEREEHREAVRGEMILQYAQDHGLNIESYQDFGWEPVKLEREETEERYFQKDGISYEKVEDLVDGKYHWASAVGEGNMIKDSHGHERYDYYTQPRWFVNLDTGEKLEVRRWDNLRYSAGDYLVYEYDGIMHVAKKEDLYHPVLSYHTRGTYGIINRVSDGYMIADDREYQITYYDETFQKIKTVEGLRAGESGIYYRDGLMAVRDMNTGLKGFLDEEGELAISCQYGDVSDFSNGFASVLTEAQIIPYTEDNGTVLMYAAKGGRWAIINTKGAYVAETSE